MQQRRNDPSRAQREAEEVVAAIFEALAASRWTEATDLVERNWTLLITYRIAVVRAVAEAIPLELLESLPRWMALRRRLRLPFGAHALGRASAPGTPDALAFLAALVELTERSVRARERGDFEQAAQLAVEAKSAFDDAAPELRGELQATASPLLQQWGTSMHYAVHDAEAFATLELAFAWASAAHNSRVAASAAGELAWIHAFAGRTAAADVWIERAKQLNGPRQRQHGQAIQLAVALRHNDLLEHRAAVEALEPTAREPFDMHGTIGAGALAAAAGQRPGAEPERVLAALEAHAATQPAARVASHLNLHALHMSRTLLLMLAGKPRKALPLLDSIAAHDAPPWVFARRAAAHLLVDDLDRAELDASRALGGMSAWPRFVIETLAVRAATSLRRGRAAEAEALFGDAVRLADTHRIPVALALLPAEEFAALRALDPGRASASLDRLDSAGVARPRPDAAHSSPTPKELQVLQAVDADAAASMQQIADGLGCSINTLKTHLRSLYAKAGVHDRVGLLAAARRYGWL